MRNCTLTVSPAGFGYRAVLSTGYSHKEFRSLTRLGAYRKGMRFYGWLHAPGTVAVIFRYDEAEK